MRRNNPHPFRDLNGNWYKDNEDFDIRAWRKSSMKKKFKKESDVKIIAVGSSGDPKNVRLGIEIARACHMQMLREQLENEAQ